LGVNSLIVMTNVMTTLHEIFTNSTVPPVPVHAEFGVCYVAFAGSHEIRYRGEKLLEVAARQLTAAATARGAKIPQCVVTDQPERTRPYVQLALPLRTSLDATPFLAKCGDYTALFKRPCKLLFGYMAKAIAAARPPYSTTVFVDTDTFVCNIEPLLAFPRLMRSFDVLLLMPRTTQGWTNSGVLGVRREASRGWAMAWQREFLSLDDFGDQLHLLKVLPARSADRRRLAASSASLPEGSLAHGKHRGRPRGGGLRVGELSTELHLRYGSVSDASAQLKLPVLRGPPMLLHSKGLASLSSFTPFFTEQYGAVEGLDPSLQQLVAVLGDSTHESKRQGQHAVYSAQALAGFCLSMSHGWSSPPGLHTATRQLVLNSAGNCSGCDLTALTPKPASVGTLISGSNGYTNAYSYSYSCSGAVGDCGVKPAAWPDGTERGLPEWAKQHIQSRSGR